MDIQRQIVTSANWDAGRNGNAVSGIVLHTMVGTTTGSYNRFNNPSSQVSVHYGVSLDGSIHQWVDEQDTAWQAGNYPVNLRTIGIEHEDNGNANDSVRTAAEYESSSSLVADICKRYGFPADTNHIFLHKNVIDKSRYPGGTACPDGLDTGKIINMAGTKLKGDDMPDLVSDRGDAINFVRQDHGDSSYSPTEAEISAAQTMTYKDWAYKLGSLNEGDGVNFSNLSGIDKATLLSQGFKHWAYAFAKSSNQSGATILKPGNYKVN